jgi:hypothetical protein
VTSPFETTTWLLRQLARATLDDRRSGMLLRTLAVLAALLALVLIAIDPSPHRTAEVTGSLGSVIRFQQSDDPDVRARIVDAWSGSGLRARVAPDIWQGGDLRPRVHLFLGVDALLFAPTWALLLLALRQSAVSRVRRDGAAFDPARVEVCAKLIAWAIAIGVIANEAVDVLAWNAVSADGRGLAADAMPYVGGIRFVADGLAVAAAAFLLARWYFLFDPTRPADDQNAAVSRRARLRGAIADMFWRSKYAMLVVGFFTGMVLLLDQTRDALLRMTQDGIAPWRIGLGVLLTSIAVLLLALASWLWPRQLLRLAAPGQQGLLADAQSFGKWWSRTLGAVPMFVAGWAIARTLHDEPTGSPARIWLEGFLALDIVGALVFIGFVGWRPGRNAFLGYYGLAGDRATARDDLHGLTALVTWGPPLVFIAARATTLAGWTPPLPLAVVASGLAAWAGVLGWLALESRRTALPYAMVAVAAMIGFAAFDFTEVHGIRVGDEAIEASFEGLPRRFLWTVLIALPCLGLAWAVTRPRATLQRAAAFAVAALLAILVLLKLHDAPEQPVAPAARPELDRAMGAWLASLPLENASRPLPVYFISAEGGGIRSAYWTASVLARLKELDPSFDERTFSLAGVSGGALGVAAFRACDLQTRGDLKRLQGCIDRFGGTDLWTQLIGGVLFEDLLATILPTSWLCDSPGCGVLGRSSWFEGTMEAAVPALRVGIAHSGLPIDGAGHRPHLFLTVTRVESGERWIQSDVIVRPERFPGACDVVAMAASDLRLSTAAHNSSRFPYTNPVGALRGRSCDGRDAELMLRARLQDGGYFDDSATSTSLDLLHAFETCLSQGCGVLTNPVGRADLRQRIRPIFIAIRNEDRFRAPVETRADACDSTRDPARPVDASPLRLWPSALSAGVTLFGTRAAHMRAADAVLETEAQLAWQRLGATPDGKPCAPWRPGQPNDPYRRFDLFDDGTLYPSGWMLSENAMRGIRDQVTRQVGAGSSVSP